VPVRRSAIKDVLGRHAKEVGVATFHAVRVPGRSRNHPSLRYFAATIGVQPVSERNEASSEPSA